MPSGEKFKDFTELKQILLSSKREQVIRHLTTQVLSYALCRKLGKGDQPVVEEITRKVLLQNATWPQLFIEVANSIPFRQTVYKVVKDGTKLEN